jgi:ribonuclease BN (tRNA processing enzyme)
MLQFRNSIKNNLQRVSRVYARDISTTKQLPGVTGIVWKEPDDKKIRKKSEHMRPLFNLTFLGTGGSNPNRYKSATCTMLNFGAESFMFDAGEGALRQASCGVQTGHVLEVNRIFITHMHADHILGLPSIVMLVCSGTKESFNDTPLHIYGPKGIYRYVTNAIMLSHCKLRRKICVHEMMFDYKEFERLDQLYKETCYTNTSMYTGHNNVPWSKDVKSYYFPKNNSMQAEKSQQKKFYINNELDLKLFAGINIERDEILPDKDGIFHLHDENFLTVKAKLIVHTVPTFGYVIQEDDIQGAFLKDKAKDYGIPPGPGFGLIKKGMDTIFEDGKIIKCEELCGPPTNGRKITILGDTCDASNIINLAKNSDIVVHESTYAKDERDHALRTGHSTPDIAAKFAINTKAKRLIINHIGSQYIPLQVSEHYAKNNSIKLDTDIQEEARYFLGRPKHCIIARDLISVSVPPGGYQNITNNKLKLQNIPNMKLNLDNDNDNDNDNKSDSISNGNSNSNTNSNSNSNDKMLIDNRFNIFFQEALVEIDHLESFHQNNDVHAGNNNGYNSHDTNLVDPSLYTRYKNISEIRHKMQRINKKYGDNNSNSNYGSRIMNRNNNNNNNNNKSNSKPNSRPPSRSASRSPNNKNKHNQSKKDFGWHSESNSNDDHRDINNDSSSKIAEKSLNTAKRVFKDYMQR